MSRKAVIVILVIAAGVLGVSAAIVIKVRGQAIPDFSKKTPEEVDKYVWSEEFAKLDGPKKGEVFGKIMISNAKQYFDMPEQERLEYLDKIIDMMEKGKQEFSRRMEEARANRKDSNVPAMPGPNDFRRMRPPGGRDGWAKMGRTMGEMISPEDSARVRAFHTAMFMRMQQRGISFFPSPPPAQK